MVRKALTRAVIINVYYCTLCSVQVMDNPIYRSAGDYIEGSSNPLHGAKSVNLPEYDDIAAEKARKKEENPYMEPQDGAPEGAVNVCYARSPPMQVSRADSRAKPQRDGACGVTMNPCYTGAPPMRVSLGLNGDEPQENEITLAENNLATYMKGAASKVRASNVSQPKKFKRQRSSEKANAELDRRPLKSGEVPPSFENPFYSAGGEVRRDEENFLEDPTYATIPAVQGVPPRLPPRAPRRLYQSQPESLEIREDDTYEPLNFGQADA